jgi:hypothetical protein
MRAMKSTKAAKAERRAHRKARHRDRDARGGFTVTPINGTIDPDVLEQLLGSVERINPTGPWRKVAPLVLPILKRVHHPYPPDAAPVHLQVPPGIWVGFGVDFGPAFSHVTAAQIDAWGIGQVEVLAVAIDNLRQRVTTEPPVVERIRRDGIEIVAIQAQGWGSSLVLAPELLAPVLGASPRLLLAPVRNTLLALPDDVDDEFALGLWDAVASGANDELDIDPLRWTGSTVVALSGGEGLLH